MCSAASAASPMSAAAAVGGIHDSSSLPIPMREPSTIAQPSCGSVLPTCGDEYEVARR